MNEPKKKTTGLNKKQLIVIAKRRAKAQKKLEKAKAEKEAEAKRLKEAIALKKKEEKELKKLANKERLAEEKRQKAKAAKDERRNLFVPPSKEILEQELAKPLTKSSSPLFSGTLTEIAEGETPSNTHTRPDPVGISYSKGSKSMVVRICHEGKRIYIGTSESPLEARYMFIDAYKNLKGIILPLHTSNMQIPGGPHKNRHLNDY